MSGSSSAWGSSSGPPGGDLLSKFVNALDNADIIASNKVSEVNWAELDVEVEGAERRPAYRRAKVGGMTLRTERLLSWASNSRSLDEMGIIC